MLFHHLNFCIYTFFSCSIGHFFFVSAIILVYVFVASIVCNYYHLLHHYHEIEYHFYVMFHLVEYQKMFHHHYYCQYHLIFLPFFFNTSLLISIFIIIGIGFGLLLLLIQSIIAQLLNFNIHLQMFKIMTFSNIYSFAILE